MQAIQTRNHGGPAGGVGSIAVQVAKSRGAVVIGTASARNHDICDPSARMRSSTTRRSGSKTRLAASMLCSTPLAAIRANDPMAAYNLKSVVTFTLTPTSKGAHLRMEQAGFRPDQKQAYGGAKAGWQQFSANLEKLLGQKD